MTAAPDDTTRTALTPAGSQVRRPARPFNAGLLVLAVFGFIALSVIYLESANLKGLVGLFVTELAFLIPMALTAVLCGIAFRRAHGAERRLWLVATGLNAILLVSELYYIWWVVSYGSPPPGIYAPFQVLHAAAAVFVYMLITSMTRMAEAPATQQVRWRLDLIGAGVVVYVVAYEAWVGPILSGLPGVTAVDKLVAAAYPTWGVMMILGLLWALVRPGAVRWRAWERMIAVSLIIYACGVIAWPLWYAAFSANPGATTEIGALDLVLVLGHYLFTIAAAERLIRPELAWPLRRNRPPRRLPGRAAAYAAVTLDLVALPVLVGLAVLAPAGSLVRAVDAAAALVVSALMVARTVVAAIDNGRLFHRSVTDPLTGLFNHRHFHERLAADLQTALRYDEPLSIMSIDLDDFEVLNRRYGHTAGDEVLRAIGGALRRACRTTDVLCRVGADEFAAILRSSDAAGALRTALRLQAELRGVSTPDPVPVTASIGIACHPTHASDAETLLRLADGAAYWVKQHGKDQVLVYDERSVSELSAEDSIRTIAERTQIGTVRALALAVDSRNPATRSRSSVVPGLASSLARRLGLAEDRVRLIETAALLRDVGMVAVGDDVFAKMGPLDEQEWESVHRHPELGEQIVGATMPELALPWIRHHHERWDGRGYPDRLRAVAIPLEARIVAVCDAWGAMTSERPYAPTLSVAEAARELRACAGAQFDPSVVDVFLESVGAEGEPA